MIHRTALITWREQACWRILAATKLEISGDKRKAEEAYAEVLHTFASDAVGKDLEPAAERWLELRWSRLPPALPGQSARWFSSSDSSASSHPPPAEGT